jgi:hypothetical protein
MNILTEIYKNIIINEAVGVDSITDSIKNRYQAVINYEGDPAHGIAPGMRVIQAYAYGLTKAGNPVIRAYQPYGDTASKVPAWKFFRIDRIISWKPTYAKTTVPAPLFNPNGDKTMSVVYTIADFNETPDNTVTNVKGPRGIKQIGKIDNIDKIIADREKEKQRNRLLRKYTPSPKVPLQNTNIKEPEVKDADKTKQQTISEPQVANVPPKPDEADFVNQDNHTDEIPTTQLPNKNIETDKSDIFKTKGDKELERIKDLNKRLDNVRKLDLNKIPRR